MPSDQRHAAAKSSRPGESRVNSKLVAIHKAFRDTPYCSNNERAAIYGCIRFANSRGGRILGVDSENTYNKGPSAKYVGTELL